MRNQVSESYQLVDERSEGNCMFRVWLREGSDSVNNGIEVAIQTFRAGVAEPLLVLTGERWNGRGQAIARARQIQDAIESTEQ